MGVEALRHALSQYRLLMLDTMVFSYQLADHPIYAPLTTIILKAIESGVIAGLSTTLTLAELLTVPAKAGNRQGIQDYELYVSNFPNLRLVPFDTVMARETAIVRAMTGLRMPDAAQVAAARVYGADAIVTNDRRWMGKFTAPALILLETYL